MSEQVAEAFPDGGYSIEHTRVPGSGAAAHRPKSGAQSIEEIASSLLEAQERLALRWPSIIRVGRFRKLTPRKRTQAVRGVPLAQMRDVNVQAMADLPEVATSRATLYRLRKNGQNILGASEFLDAFMEAIEMLMYQAHVLEAIERVERKLDRVMADCAETAVRLRERFPNDAEVAEAVDRFLRGIPANTSNRN
jgi:hypothetical protein